jgi:DNA-binding SARP family transcriptional activator
VAVLGGWKAALATLPLLALPLVKSRRRTPLTIHVIGGFHVEPPAQWPSKKARTLLKILVAKRGRPVAREQLMEYLWPGEDPRKLGNRLSVALTALRTAIGADAIVTRDGTVALSGVRVDVEEFLARPHRHRFAGELLPEDRYEDWAADLREAYTTALRTKAGETRRDDEAIRIYVHLLEHDPYDRPAHAALVARLDRAGRHGEAISRRRDYIRAMAEIGVQAAV